MKVLLILLSILVGGCAQQTKEVSSGTYGPFSIGENKSSALAKTERITTLSSVVAVASRELYIENPSQSELHQLDEDDGILVWVDHHPWPLRIELENNAVAKIWGAPMPCTASKERMNIACTEINRLSAQFSAGMSRQDAYRAIVTFHTSLSKQVGNFVVGPKELSPAAQATAREYRNFLLSKNGWQFEGLKELPRFNEPFYSTVTLYFRGDRLIKIKHWSAPYELP
jgi:hypothetical protein